MHKAPLGVPHNNSDDYASSPEALVVALARTGDQDAFAELVRRRQSWIRNLMRRFSGDITLADDLAQQVFLQAWRKIRHLQHPNKFGAWLKRLAINIWLQHIRVGDTLRDAHNIDAQEAEEQLESIPARQVGSTVAMDLDRALAHLQHPQRLCIVLSYHDGMTHEEIAGTTGMPLGTVKSHIRRGTQHLQHLLSDYRKTSRPREAP